MQFIVYVGVLFFLFLSGCASPPPPQIAAYPFEPPTRKLDYLADVKPILEKRCVVCHSCYNSPCQLKLSSWEGLDRGASKEKIYNAGRLKTMDPSRLFVDAHSTKEWREKGFYNVTKGAEQNVTESMMYMLLDHKRVSPKVSGEYYSEAGDLTCSENKSELESYLKKHPNNGMPFGFPPLKKDEFNMVVGWLGQGAQGPSAEQQAAIEAIPKKDQAMVDMWESFLNIKEPKFQMTARYLYDHLFLAHVTFKTGTGEFYELVRSTTRPGKEIDVIGTVRPYDPPGSDKYYYRFRKIYSTIVHKTHMVFAMDKKHFKRVKQLFIQPEWEEEPHVMGYDPIVSANPFVTYQQIPAKSRYQWLLDNAHYVIMTFIRGPVCKGQVALNVVNDHFWLMFVDPKHDLSVKYPGFLKLNGGKLRVPSEVGSDYKLYKALLKNKHYAWAVDYYKARELFYAAHYPDGMTTDVIWKGNRPDDQPIMTVFRHFDSASVHRGVLGNLPRTAWVVDYPLLERIYYSLVAGFDVYGTAGHQLGTRLYMDALRLEGESYFLDFMPPEKRKEIMDSWYVGVKEKKLHFSPAPIPSGVEYNTDDPKREFIEKVVNTHLDVDGITFGKNYLPAGVSYPALPEKYEKMSDFIDGFIATSAPGVSFFKQVANHNANVAWVRLKNIPKIGDRVVSAVVHRWHDNVRVLFREKSFFDSDKDRVEFYPGFIGSYPNYFFDVEFEDLPDFFDILGTFDGSEEDQVRLNKYGVNRAQADFWDVYDWFQDEFNKSDPVNSGLADLNRYYFFAAE